MKQIIFLLLLATPMAMQAEEKNDTAFTVGNRKIVVSMDSMRTDVKVYDTSGREQLKIKETEFIDGTDVERVFVGSPFIPTPRLQNIKFHPRFPTLWFGSTRINDKFIGGDGDNIHGSTKFSLQVGVTPYAFAFALGKSQLYGVSAAIQATYNQVRFQRDWSLEETDGNLDFHRLDTRAKRNQLSFYTFRLPVVFSFDNNDMSIGIGLAPVLRTNGRYRLSWKNDEGTNIDKTYKLKRIGLDMDMYISCGPIIFTGNVNITPTLKTASGKNIFQGTIGIGVNLWELPWLNKK